MSQAEPDDTMVRQILLNDCDNYIYNSLPTYLLDISCIHTPDDRIRLSDIKLVSRNQISKAIFDQVESDLRTVPPSGREKWCKVKHPVPSASSLKSLTLYKIGQTRVRGYKSKHRYAIMSHRWGIDEPTFQRMMKGEEHSKEEPPAGIRKLLGFCKVAATEYNCSYAWSDTCCIDKQSSAELEEAIRSMYRWYADSEICIVYLGASSLLDHLKYDPWFRRGWTLQELLAPEKIKFYGRSWRPINSSRSISNDKDDEAMRRTIEEVTGIPGDDIRSFRPSCDRVSEKMTWMAPRQTTKVEDIAYSLIGIFDITIPISYGEGAWAFHRLMEAVAQRCFDPGFFAWCGDPSPYSLALPRSPSCYALDADGARLLRLRGFEASSEVHSGDPSYTMTKTGLQVNVLLVPIEDSSPFSPIDTYTLPEKPKVAIPLVTPAMDLTPARIRSARPGSTHALGVVNYHPVSRDWGSVSARSNYFCLLLRRHDSNTWRKEPTNRVVVLKCEGTLRGKVGTVLLAHNSRLYFAS